MRETRQEQRELSHSIFYGNFILQPKSLPTPETMKINNFWWGGWGGGKVREQHVVQWRWKSFFFGRLELPQELKFLAFVGRFATASEIGSVWRLNHVKFFILSAFIPITALHSLTFLTNGSRFAFLHPRSKILRKVGLRLWVARRRRK